MQLDHRLGRRLCKALADAHVPRHPGPPPRVDLQRRGATNVSIARVAWPRPARRGSRRTGRARGACESSGRIAANTFAFSSCRKLASGPTGGSIASSETHLQEVVLQDVADGADPVVERATTLDADGLRHRDLHAAHVVAVPDRLEQRVGEAEHEEVLDALLAEVVVDAEDAVLGEHLRAASRSARGPMPDRARTASRPRSGRASLSPTDASDSATVGNIDGGIAM